MTVTDAERFAARTCAGPDTTTLFWTGEGYAPRTVRCLIWTGGANTKGFGRFWDSQRTCWTAKRFAYAQEHGPIPEGHEINQLCRNTRCVEPAHLEAVTTAESVRRFTIFHRLAETCPHGHLWSETARFNANGSRYCGECNRLHARRWYAEHPRPPRPPKAPATHCKNGHEWTKDNTYTSPAGARNCRKCNQAAVRRYQRK